MPKVESSRRLLHARLGVFGVFSIAGFLTAIWLVNIPAIQGRTGVDHAVLGGLILLLGLGAIISMQLSGRLLGRLGSRTSMLVGLGVLVVTVNLPGLATDAYSLAAALFLFGIGHGVTDVAMNQHAVVVEWGYRRPIMSAFHAFYSLGGAVGAIAGAWAQAVGLDLLWTLFGAGISALAVTALSAPMLLPKEAERRLESGHHSAGGEQKDPGHASQGTNRRQIVALALFAFLAMLSEGAANDWSALQTVEHLGASESAAALAYGAVATAMTAGRLCADRISDAIGAVNSVRLGSLAAALGMLVVVTSPLYPITLAGWLLFGLGLSGILPRVYTAAGYLGRSDSGRTLSHVVSCGYVGLLAGPAVIGWLGGMVGLTLALLVPLAFCAAGLFLAPQVAVAKPKPEEEEAAPAGTSGSGGRH